MNRLKLTKDQLFDLASKLFDIAHEGKFGKLKDNDSFIQNDWINEAWDSVEGYDIIIKYVDFPGVSIVKNCCRTCRHVDLYRPACNLRGDDIDLECVCSHFELFEFENERDDQ